jgi:hypothetical protein
MLSEAVLSEAPRETPETMREKLRAFRELDPDKYRAMFRTLLPLDALPSDALSDQQLEVNCDAMLKGLAQLADPHGARGVVSASIVARPCGADQRGRTMSARRKWIDMGNGIRMLPPPDTCRSQLLWAIVT